MSKQTRKQYNASFKSNVALEAIRGLKTTAEISSDYKVHSSQIHQWKKQLLGGIGNIFNNNTSIKHGNADETITNELYEQIGRLKVELDWVKKKSNLFP